jgi:hypothetical protein
MEEGGIGTGLLTCVIEKTWSCNRAIFHIELRKKGRWTLHAIEATWTNGQILPSEPVDWPEGSELLVEPVTPNSEKIGLSEEEWRDDAEAIAQWEAWVRSIEPLEFTAEERANMARYKEEFRRFNIEAVRRQTEAREET